MPPAEHGEELLEELHGDLALASELGRIGTGPEPPLRPSSARASTARETCW